MTRSEAGLKYRKIPRFVSFRFGSEDHASGFMTAKSPSPPLPVSSQQPCKHPRVQIVSRDEDAEFVECLECGEIFESSEFKDMSIEERTRSSEL